MLRIAIITACLAFAGCSLLTRTQTGEWHEPHPYSRHFDDWIARTQAEKRALVALGKCYPHAASDFKYGFVQAYVDVALGGNGALPAFPPERYWYACRRDPQGYRDAGVWYAGYAAGAQRALSSRWHAHNQIPGAGL